MYMPERLVVSRDVAFCDTTYNPCNTYTYGKWDASLTEASHQCTVGHVTYGTRSLAAAELSEDQLTTGSDVIMIVTLMLSDNYI